MTDTYRALCADLADIVTAHANPDDDAVGYVAAVLTRARAALAAEPDSTNNRELLLNKKYKTYEAFIQEVGYDDEQDD